MADPLAYHNGQFVPRSAVHLSFHDAGIVMGATVTDFCRTYAGRLLAWSEHLTRFRRDCDLCRIPLPTSDAELTEAAERLVDANREAGSEQALITFATPGPMGYLVGETGSGPPTVVMHTMPIRPARYRRFYTEGATLAEVGVLGEGIVPRHAKHRSRLAWWLAERHLTEMQAPPGAIAVLTAADGTAPDTALGAVVPVRGSTLVYPEPGSVLDSVTLALLKDVAPSVGLSVTTASFRLDDPADEWLLVGSGLGIVGVVAIVTAAGRRSQPWPGPVLQRLQGAWSARVGVDIVRATDG